VDPFAVLGLAAGADERELIAAYREAAKRWHPDRAAVEGAEDRMAEINVAYDLLRASLLQDHASPGQPAAAAAAAAAAAGGPGRRGAGAWLTEPVRRALGPELLQALGDGEPVRLVTPASAWASPRAILAVTDRRLLWLLDDAPVARVRSLAFREIAAVAQGVRRPRRRTATLTLRTLSGRRLTFTGLRPDTAAAIERRVREARPRAA
jgi:hypothetical protein